MDTHNISQLQTLPGYNTNFVPSTTNPPLINERRMLESAMDFRNFLIDGLIDRSTLTSTTSGADKRKTWSLAPQILLNEGLYLEVQVLLANEHFERLSETIDLQFQVEVILFNERLKVMTNITGSKLGIFSLHGNNSKLDTHHGVVTFPSFSLKLNHADNTCSIAMMRY